MARSGRVRPGEGQRKPRSARRTFGSGGRRPAAAADTAVAASNDGQRHRRSAPGPEGRPGRRRNVSPSADTPRDETPHPGLAMLWSPSRHAAATRLFGAPCEVLSPSRCARGNSRPHRTILGAAWVMTQRTYASPRDVVRECEAARSRASNMIGASAGTLLSFSLRAAPLPGAARHHPQSLRRFICPRAGPAAVRHRRSEVGMDAQVGRSFDMGRRTQTFGTTHPVANPDFGVLCS